MTGLFSLFACALFFMALLFSVFQVKRWGRYWPLAYVLTAVLLVLPIGHWLLIEFVRGYVSDLSTATMLICTAYLWNVVRPQSNKVQLSFKWFVVVIAMLLYPMSMGLTQFDPFTMGFPSNQLYDYLLVGLFSIGLLSWLAGCHHIAIVITFAVLANGLQVYESQNLWVYLIDPIAVIICGVSLLMQGITRVINRFKVAGTEHV